ncbi:MAG: DnaJ domain-containing protein [Myxococcota bacterium]
MAQRRPLTEEETGRIDAMASAREGTLYDTLGLQPAATAIEIEDAYHDLARQWHPDRFYSRDSGDRGPVIEENFVAATRAYRILRDPIKRQGYHREAGIDPKAAPVAPPREAPPPPPPRRTQLAPLGSGGVSAGDTSPGGTRVYETGIGRAPLVPPPPPKPKPPTAVDKIRQHIGEQQVRARSYYDAGKADFDAGRFAKAESAFYLAMKFDPQNPTYAPLYEQAAGRAREGRAKGFIAQAEQEESYGRTKEAIGWYQKAVECDPPEGLAYFRLAHMLRTQEQDSRGAVANLRKAVAKEPRNIPYRLALADLYESLKMTALAVREAQAALEVDPKSVAAKAMLKRLRK